MNQRLSHLAGELARRVHPLSRPAVEGRGEGTSPTLRLLCTLVFLLLTTLTHAADRPLVMTVLEQPDIARGAGLAIILQTPSGKTFLYDTGNGYPEKDGRWANDFNCGRDLIAPFLAKHHINHLDGVLISHAHYDHFGGLLWLVDHIPVNQLIDSGYVFAGQMPDNYSGELGNYNKLRDTFKKHNAYLQANTGDKLSLDPALVVDVIAPPTGFFSEPHPEKRPKNDPPAHYLVNSNSLGVKITHGNIVFLLPGDIQAEDQVQSLIPSLPPGALKCDVLIAPGHGIHSTKEFAEAATPKLTIASIHARWGLRSPAFKRFGDVGSKVYVTGLHGNITVTSDGSTFTTTLDRPNGLDDPKKP